MAVPVTWSTIGSICTCWKQIASEPEHDKTNKMACALNVDSDPPSLRFMCSYEPKPSSGGHADANADLSLCWAYRSLCWFCRALAQIISSFEEWHNNPLGQGHSVWGLLYSRRPDYAAYDRCTWNCRKGCFIQICKIYYWHKVKYILGFFFCFFFFVFFFYFCFTALQHILGHFGRGQLP